MCQNKAKISSPKWPKVKIRQPELNPHQKMPTHTYQPNLAQKKVAQPSPKYIIQNILLFCCLSNVTPIMI